MLIFPELSQAIISAMTAAGACFVIFDRLESIVSQKLRDSILEWLCKKPNSDPWPVHASNLLDRFFGYRHLSIKCFMLSCLVSYASASLLLFLLILLNILDIQRLLEVAGTLPLVAEHGYTVAVIGFIARFLFTAAFMNLLPDYISLFESRVILNKMRSSRSLLGILLWLFIDFVASFIIIVFGLYFVVILEISTETIRGANISFLESLHILAKNFPATLLALATFQQPIFSVFFYCTFSTSVWVWLYAFSALLLRSLRSVWLLKKIIRYIFDVEKQPVRAIGAIGSIIIFLLILGLGIFT